MNITLQSTTAIRPVLAMAAITLIGFGFLYSLTGAAFGQLLFPYQARGSIIVSEGKPVASALVAQPFTGAGYVQPRPSAANYDPMSAAGSNMGRNNPELLARMETLRTQIAQRDGIAPSQVAPDLLTQSGSGLDPEISVAAATQQIHRIAATRELSPQAVQAAIKSATTSPQFGFLGPERVNVIRANVALDRLQ